jgi:hypothetical protein
MAARILQDNGQAQSSNRSSSPPPGFSAGAAVVQIRVGAPVDRVWSVLADGFSYAAWVVGASHMRAVDVGFPAPGAKLHHAVGVWPVLLRDSTEVEALDEGRSLVLLARGRPIGEARVRFDLVPTQDGGCTVTMTEDAISAHTRTVLPAPVRAALIGARNRETLARLTAICERRAHP